MSENGSPDDFLLDVLKDFDVGQMSYEDLSNVARRWIAYAVEQSSSNSIGPTSENLERLARFVQKRHFTGFRRILAARGSMQTVLTEIFLLSRIRTYALAYLSVQEGEDFEGAAGYETNAPLLISQTLYGLGRKSNGRFHIGFGRFRVQFDFDPLLHLRRIYALHLFECRSKRATLGSRAAIVWHRWNFIFKSRLTARVTRFLLRSKSGGDAGDSLLRMLRRPPVRRLLFLAIHLLFPAASTLNEQQWLALLSRLETYLVPRLVGLTAVISQESVTNHGYVKLFKVAFGTAVGRISVRHRHEKDDVDFIINTIRLAYSWGITYPLVDNVLDSNATDDSQRVALVRSLVHLFTGNRQPEGDVSGDETSNVAEVNRRLTEVLSLIPADQLDVSRRFLRHLLESHRRDASRRLSLTELNDTELEKSVMVDTALKSASIRLATMAVCGIKIDRETIARCLSRSLFNQLGDDLWDIYEDNDDDRITPYTLHLARHNTVDPFDFYFRYTMLIANGQSNRRKTAALIGYCETLRDSLAALELRKSDSLQVADAIESSLRESGGKELLQFVRDIPHVDFDAVLFAFEAALFEAVD